MSRRRRVTNRRLNRGRSNLAFRHVVEPPFIFPPLGPDGRVRDFGSGFGAGRGGCDGGTRLETPPHHPPRGRRHEHGDVDLRGPSFAAHAEEGPHLDRSLQPARGRQLVDERACPQLPRDRFRRVRLGLGLRFARGQRRVEHPARRTRAADPLPALRRSRMEARTGDHGGNHPRHAGRLFGQRDQPRQFGHHRQTILRPEDRPAARRRPQLLRQGQTEGQARPPGRLQQGRLRLDADQGRARGSAVGQAMAGHLRQEPPALHRRPCEHAEGPGGDSHAGGDDGGRAAEAGA